MDVGTVSGSELTLYYTDKSTNLNPKYVAYNSLDCLTFDFDIRSETGIMPDILFETNAVDADTGELFFIQFYLIFN